MSSTVLPAWAENVSRETFLQLESYTALLLKWNPRINLIGPATENDIWSRHIADSLQLLPLIPATTISMADVGSGAGLPGLVIAISRPEIEVHLIEHDQRKAAFLREASAQLHLKNTIIHAVDIQTISRQFDVVTARALASLTKLFALTYPLLSPHASCLFPKGAGWITEVEEATQGWEFDYQPTASKTNQDSSILSITKVRRKEH